ncbi:MAG: BamA/TamA family outer membrane protein [Acidobacteria bacterium]|nr:BamA/TamA family outer membrane protein [Acidobacteriota bacterium]
MAVRTPPKAWLVLGIVLLTTQAFAQSQPDVPTRIRSHRPSQVRKNLLLGPLFPVRLGFSGLGKALNKGALVLQEKRTLERLQEILNGWKVAGFVPIYGAMGDGAGFALGLDYTRPLGRFEVKSRTQASAKFYQNYQLQFMARAGPVQFGPVAGFRHRPQEEFFGSGPDSLKSDRTTFSFEDENAGWLTTAAFGRASLSHHVRWKHVEIGRGTDGRFPELQQVFDESQAVGRFASDDWFANEFAFTADLRDNAADPRMGLSFEASADLHRGIEDTAADYDRYRAAAFAYVPLSRSKEHVLALRSELVHTDSDGELPFYAEPTLGGSGSLRGFREYRFRDRDSFLATAEYRYEVWRHMDAVLFADLGQVYRNVFDELSARSLRSSSGIGLRFKTSTGVAMRIHAGNSIEGARLFFTFGPTW